MEQLTLPGIAELKVKTRQRNPVGVTLSDSDLELADAIKSHYSINRSAAIRFCIEQVHNSLFPKG